MSAHTYFLIEIEWDIYQIHASRIPTDDPETKEEMIKLLDWMKGQTNYEIIAILKNDYKYRGECETLSKETLCWNHRNIITPTFIQNKCVGFSYINEVKF